MTAKTKGNHPNFGYPPGHTCRASCTTPATTTIGASCRSRSSTGGGVNENKHSTDVEYKHTMSKQSDGTRPEASLAVYLATQAPDFHNQTRGLLRTSTRPTSHLLLLCTTV